jgi:putative copper resistance protein D
MPALYYIGVTVHLLAALVWLGGMFFLGLVGAPALRAIESAELRQRLFDELGRRFRTVGWVCIAVLAVTGVANLYYRGLLHWQGVLGTAAFWRTNIGYALAVKLAIVTLMIAISAVHDFIDGPAAGRLVANSPRALVLRRRAALMARVNAILGVVLVIAAVRLARGG